jgi:hypothetical protein
MILPVDALQPEPTEPVNVLFLGQNEIKAPSAASGGTVGPAGPFIVAVVAVSVFGTVPATAPQTLVPMELSVASHPTADEVARRYEALRAEIVRSGSELLDDEALRAEIKDRRGIRDL